MKCQKGLRLIYIRFNGDISKLSELEGHGVGVIDFTTICSLDAPTFKEIGSLALESLTIVGKSGGASLDVGDIIVHTPQMCADGWRRYCA